MYRVKKNFKKSILNFYNLTFLINDLYIINFIDPKLKINIVHVKIQELNFLSEYYLITILFCFTLFALFSLNFTLKDKRYLGIVYSVPLRLFFHYAFSQMRVNLFSLKKVTSLTEITITIRTFFNNLLTISSFLITPPNSLGKMSMISWCVDKHEESMFIVGCVLAEFFLLVTALLGFLLIYIVYKKDTFFIDKVIPYFKKLSPIRKIIFGSFTVFNAIPNKFWINVEIHFILVFIISTTIYTLGFVFPFLFFCYFMYIILCFESFTFGLLYDYSENFRKYVNFFIFGSSNEPFAADYFYWFWGNMCRQAGKKAGPLIAGAAVVEAKRQKENKEKNAYADKQTEEASANTKQGFNDPKERTEFHKDRREEWVEENGTITKIIKSLKNWFYES